MKKMKLTLFGATGKTGKYLIEEALIRGFEVTVFVRTQTIFDHPHVTIIRGDINDQNMLKKAIQGTDAVLSALGPTSFHHPMNTPITKAMESIINVMKQENIQRLIAISTGTAKDPNDGFDFKIWFPALFIKFLMRNAYTDIIKLASVIRASDLNWTMVRVAFLTNQSVSTHLNIGLYGHTKHKWYISRQNVAKFILDQISKTDFIQQAPGIS
ncbi:NAD(P)-dependent oxidoreductase [Acinetobacter baumannii]|uniref:NAD(P)-dependent oxidoreductase n=1 Tax=Acinetobacter baumannii TaxID=470 RepID=UPI0001AF280A|nr:SDR family oxidoreductase [Acinetobacter baumannii]EHU1904296.1 SDR family oxidoreductase [Acinetobacter baumannii]EHU1920976.1 SDR family oxidoreductase [Acinetobacter baumannii]EHU1965552.1 SDR family oxidoreductase [Acinetobacter baumannii]EKP43796.1 NADH(P)-binding protein, PF13460 family [Acinetobacter baumannii OIFC111]EKT7957788.1 SDR family oxidoreductase [Acinetobacter baumannii]